MALHENTLIDLVRMVGRLGIDEYWEGTATGGTTKTLIDTASRSESDDFFQNLHPIPKVKVITTTDGSAPMGEERLISDYASATNTITISTVGADFTAAPGAGDEYVILSEFSWDEIKAAINDAINHVAGDILIPAIDSTIVLTAAVYEYPISSDFVFIHRVTMPDGNGVYYDPIPPNQWEIIQGMDTPRLFLNRFPEDMQFQGHYFHDLWADSEMVAGRVLRVEGLKKQSKLVSNTDLCYLNPAYIWRHAASVLHGKRMFGEDNEMHRDKYALFKQEANEEKNKLSTNLPLGSKRVRS